jgi:hypothetical protein
LEGGWKKVIKWGQIRIATIHPVPDLKLEYCPFLHDPLDWGPQHVDLATQHLMRCCYFGWSLEAYHEFDQCCQAVESGDEVVFWADPELRSCLAILWALESLVARGSDLRKAYLVLSPGNSRLERLHPDAIHQAFAERIPVPAALAPLIAVRRHLASDSDMVRADLSSLPSPVREWVAVTDRLEDFLPDERGLDIMDGILLDELWEERQRGREWPAAVWVTCQSGPYPTSHELDDQRLWKRLLELSGAPAHGDELDPRRHLVQVRFPGRATFQEAEFRITALGCRAREGVIDALPYCGFIRWVGGRPVSYGRPLRRSSGGVAAG